MCDVQKEVANQQRLAASYEPDATALQEAVAARGKELHALTKRINEVTDRMFAEFSKRVGVSSVREYEETAVRAAEKLASDRSNLDSQVGGPQCPTLLYTIPGSMREGAWLWCLHGA